MEGKRKVAEASGVVDAKSGLLFSRPLSSLEIRERDMRGVSFVFPEADSRSFAWSIGSRRYVFHSHESKLSCFDVTSNEWELKRANTVRYALRPPRIRIICRTFRTRGRFILTPISRTLASTN